MTLALLLSSLRSLPNVTDAEIRDDRLIVTVTPEYNGGDPNNGYTATFKTDTDAPVCALLGCNGPTEAGMEDCDDDREWWSFPVPVLQEPVTLTVLGILVSLTGTSVTLTNADTGEVIGTGRWDPTRERITDSACNPRTSAAWWAWHDQDAARWSTDTETADERCAEWLRRPENGDGPEGDWVWDRIDEALSDAIDAREWGEQPTTYRVETRDSMGQWTREGCWGSEYAQGLTEAKAQEAMASLQALYPDNDWRVVPE